MAEHQGWQGFLLNQDRIPLAGIPWQCCQSVHGLILAQQRR